MNHHSVSDAGLALIKQFEGFSAKAYICPAGYPTIGYGHMIKAGESFPAEGISGQQAENLLKTDVKIAEINVNQLVIVPLAQCQFDALVSLVYNIGGHAFEKSTLLSFLNAGEYEKAAREFGRWIYSNGRQLEGLIRRRAAETLLFNQTH